MSDLIVFPDAEDVFGTWLQGALTAHGRPRTVSTLGPDDTNRPAASRSEYIRIEAIGGNSAGLVVEDVTFVIESYADTKAAAIATAQVCRAIVAAAPRMTGSPVYASEVTSPPQSLPDPRTALARYTQTVTIRLRGAAA